MFLYTTRNGLTGTSANSEDPDEIPHNVAFHQACLLRQIVSSSEKGVQYFWESLTCEPTIYIIDDPGFIICSSDMLSF